MYEFVIEKCDFLGNGVCNIYQILQESPLDLKAVMNKVLEFTAKYPNGVLIEGAGHLIEYAVDGAGLSCYVDYYYS